MKKLLALLLVLTMIQVPVLSMAEGLDNLDNMTNTADILEEMPVDEAPAAVEPAEPANPAERRVNTVVTIKEFKGIDVGDSTINAAVQDFIHALGLVFSQQGNENEFTLQISGQDVLNVGAAFNGQDFCLSSNLLGGAVVVNMDDIEPLIINFLDVLVAMEVIPAETAGDIKEVVGYVFDELINNMDVVLETIRAQVVDFQALAEIDYTALETAANILLENMEYVEAPALPKMCDASEGGVQLKLNNGHIVEIVRAFLDFVNNNPMVKQYLAIAGDCNTEEEVQALWELYEADGYEDEAEFRSRFMTVDGMLKEAYAGLETAKFIEGDFILGLYFNGVGEPVYGVMTLPTTETMVEIVYTRQTMGENVSYVINITLDGRTVTIDALATAESTVINLFAVDGAKALDLTFFNVGEDALKAVMNAYNDEEVIFSLELAGEWEFSDIRSYLNGKITMTNHDTYGGEPDTIELAVNADYVIAGEEMNGATVISYADAQYRMAVQIATETTAAKAPMMDGALRLVELDVPALQSWVEGVIGNLPVVLLSAMMALPESVLMLVLSYAGM